MYIFQPDRFLLKKEIHDLAHYIKGRVLDVGAGEYDRYGKMFTAQEYVRMDVQEGFGVDVIGSAEEIPFPDESFDSIICTQVFEHLPHPMKAAREIHRALKKGGVVLITVPQVNELHEEPNDFFRYTCFGLESMFKEAGFEMVEKIQRGGFFTTMVQLKIRYLIDRFYLYRRPILGRIVGKVFFCAGRGALWLDKVDSSQANKKHALGWCFVFKK